MKVVLTLFAIALTMQLFSRVEADCVLNGETLTTGRHVRNCIVYMCLEDGNLTALACPLSRCSTKQVGWQPTDLNKPFPECCERPICAPKEEASSNLR